MSIIDLRYAKLGTREELNADNIVLAFMQPGIEKDTGDTKLGDGRTKYRDLAYFTGSLTRTYRGQVASESEMTALQANISDWCTRTDDGNRNYELTKLPAKHAANWTSYISGTIENGVSLADMTAAITAAKIEAQDRSKGTGFDPAANVKFADATILEAWRQSVETRLAGASPSAPSITSDPTIATTTGSDGALGSIMTMTDGTTSGTVASTIRQWSRGNATTPFVAIPGATGTTYQRTTTDYNQGGTPYRLTATQIVVGSTGLQSAPRTSAQSSATTASAPTAGTPTVSPSGSNPDGTALTFNPGTASGGSGSGYSYGIQLYIDAAGGTAYAPVGTRSAATSFTATSAQRGTARIGVIATDSNGIASTEAFSSQFTISGTVSLSLTAPAFAAATVRVGEASAFTNSTPTPGTATLVSTRIYVDSATTPYASIAAGGTYTPEADGNAFLLSATGLTTLVGHTVYCDQIWSLGGVNQPPSPKSAGKVVAAVSATFATTVDNTGMAWTQNSAITAVKPVSATGGTAPYTYAITASTTALPSGLSLNSSTGQVTGTPTPITSGTYSITVTDAVGATSTKTFTASVAAPGVSALAYATFSGARAEAPTDGDATGYVTKPLSAGAVPPLSNITTVSRGGVVRFGPTTLNGQPAILHRAVQGDPLRNGGNRSECSLGGFNFANGEEVWFAAAYKFDPDCAVGVAGDMFLVQQTHQNASTTPGNPFSLTFVGATNGQYLQGLNWITSYQNNDYIRLNTPVSTSQVMCCITRYRSGFTASGHAPIMEAWVAYGTGAYTKLVDVGPWTASQQFGDPLSTTGSNNDWPKIGVYKFTPGSYGSSPSRTVISSGLFAEKGADLLERAKAALLPFAAG